MNLESAADALYGLAPEEFIPARTALVAQARAAKDRPLATAVGALKKPTRSAWLVNLLPRGDADALAPLRTVGERLVRAHQQADLAAMRGAGAERQRIVDGLTRRAIEAGAERGYSTTEAVRLEVHGTLDAAVADAEALDEVLRGRVTKARVYSGFGFPLGMTPQAPVAGEPASVGETDEPESEDEEELQTVQQAARQAAQQAMAEATDRLTRARAALAQAESSEQTGRDALDRASQEVADLRAELRKAEQAEEGARRSATAAADDVHDARTVVQQAEQALAEAARALS